MYRSSAYLLIVLFGSWLIVGSHGLVNKICTEYYDRDACQQIARDQEFACAARIRSMVDCFLNIDQGLPHFAIVKPEEALLAAPLVSEKVVVIGEVFPVLAQLPYQTAVIIRKPYDGGFENLRGKRLCHPGFKHDELVSKLVLEEFESKIISLDGRYCDTGDNTSTIVEKRIRTVANFFGPSCRPGAWTESDELDGKLKAQYSSLCELCGSERCNVVYQVPFNETLSCLTQKGGDIAITTLNDALVFFNTSSNVENFQYLCSNGSVSTKPCTWTKQLNRLIISGTDNAEQVRTYIQNKLTTYISAFNPQSVSSDAYLAYLEKVLNLAKTDRINLTETQSLKTYVEARRNIPTVSSSIQCGLTVKWCTLNENEQQKCKWLQQAALNSGLQPVIECSKSNDTDALSCLNDIKDGKADIAFTDVNYGYIALKKGLTVVAYPETDTRQLSAILIAVRSDAEIKNLNDLKGKKACFPEYGGKEWLAFIDTLRMDKVLDNSCDYGKLFSDFVGSSCVPAANSNDYEIENTDQSKLCAQCIPVSNTLTHAYCNADYGNKYYGTDGALRCLSELAGDYAVITKNDVKDFNNISTEFRVLSRNGSLSEYAGFNIDEKAYLTIITGGEVISKINNTKQDDIALLLRGIELEFGQKIEKPFKVFESFNYTKDLLFPDSTPGLTFGGTTIKYVDNFKNLLSNSEKCMIENQSGGGAFTIIPSTVLMIIVIYFALRF